MELNIFFSSSFIFCSDPREKGTVPLFEKGLTIFFQFPFWNGTFIANPTEPFVSEPPCGAAVFRISDDEPLLAVGHDFGLISNYVY
jgi:hypothetical protein